MCPNFGNPGWSPCSQPTTTYTTQYTNVEIIDWTERLGEQPAQNHTETIGETSTRQISWSHTIPELSIGESSWLNQYLIGFSAHGTKTALKLSFQQPSVAKFLQSCKVPSPDQAALIKSIADRKAADEAATKARVEQARIAQAQADEQARLAAEAARIAQEKRDAEAAAQMAAREKRRADAIVQFCGGPNSSPTEAALASLFAGHTALAVIDLGYSGSTQSPIIVNGRPAEFPIKTEVYPNGRIKYRIEHGILHADAAKYRTFTPMLEYRLDKVEAKSDSLEIKLPPTLPSTEVGTLKLMLERGWQSSMTSEQVVELVEKNLVIRW